MTKSRLSNKSNAPAAFVDPFAVPAVAPATTLALVEESATASKGGPARLIASDALDAAHATFTAKGETRIVFGAIASGLEMISADLRTIDAIAGNGSLGAMQVATCHQVTDSGRYRLRANGAPMALGAVIPAPAGESGAATKATHAVIVGYLVEGPVEVALTQRKGSWCSGRTATIDLRSGRTLSLAVMVRTAVEGDPSEWNVTARIYSGGPVEETPAETLALAALDAAKGDAATAMAILNGSIGTKGTRAAASRGQAKSRTRTR